jgi:tellurite methyltransferase
VRWPAYYDAVADQPPHSTLVDAATRFESEGSHERSAVDLGCGSGRDTIELLRRGWRVLSIDAEPEGIRRLRAAAPTESALETRVQRVEDAHWPDADLVNASYSLFFLAPVAFASVWRRVLASLRPGGRFAGQILGDRDTWAADAAMTHHDRGAARRLFEGLELERFDEDENPDGRTATGAAKHWHVFHVVARKR